MEQICWLSSIMRISSILTKVVDSADSGLFGIYYTAAGAAPPTATAYGIVAVCTRSAIMIVEKENNSYHVVERPTRMSGCAMPTLALSAQVLGVGYRAGGSAKPNTEY